MSELRSYGWGVINAIGTPMFDEVCVAPSRAHLIEAREGGYPDEQLVELFYRLPAEEPRAVVEPAPAPARWRCEGCGENPVKGTPWIIPFSPDPMLVHGENGYYCGPVVPVGEAGS